MAAPATTPRSATFPTGGPSSTTVSRSRHVRPPVSPATARRTCSSERSRAGCFVACQCPLLPRRGGHRAATFEPVVLLTAPPEDLAAGLVLLQLVMTLV